MSCVSLQSWIHPDGLSLLVSTVPAMEKPTIEVAVFSPKTLRKDKKIGSCLIDMEVDKDYAAGWYQLRTDDSGQFARHTGCERMRWSWRGDCCLVMAGDIIADHSTLESNRSDSGLRVSGVNDGCRPNGASTGRQGQVQETSTVHVAHCIGW